MKTTYALLRRLKNANAQNDFGGILRQAIAPPEPLGAIPTLLGQRRMLLTPMLEERFRFGGTWLNAAASQTWLGLSEMARYLKQKAVQRQISLRLRHWPQSELASAPKGCVSLFGINTEDQEETYLIFKNKIEPLIVTYIGHEEQSHAHLNEYLRFLLAS